jgi:acyl-CoA reductase-like NAD-dependent aldehyde dehydrogenase
MADERTYVNGEWVDAIDGGRFDVVNPATGQVVATVPDARAADVDRAVDAARRTFDEGGWWPRTSERDRGRILLRAAEIVRHEQERLARMETTDSGKPITEARDDIATQPAPSEAPWGGYKQSGVGRELGAHGIEDYLEAKHIYVNLSP